VDKNDKKDGLKQDYSKILTLSGEQVHLVIKAHFLTVVPNIILAIFITIGFVLVSLGSLMIFKSFMISLLGLLMAFLVGFTILTQSLVNWFYHIYIVTSRKLLEVRYSPIAGYVANEIFLDQVKCTEIDMNSGGVIQQLFNIGNVAITFDRPTHKQQFIISSIKNYRQVGTDLTNKLIDKPPPDKPKAKEVWFKNVKKPSGYIFTEEISSV